MQQLEYIKQKLQMRQFPSFDTKQFGTLRAPQIILASLLISFIFSIVGIESITYLTLGFGIPIVCRYKDIKLFNYWECLAFLLFFRNFTDSFQTLDGLFLVLLWHPSFKYAQKIVEWIKSYKEKGQVTKAINQVKKMM